MSNVSSVVLRRALLSRSRRYLLSLCCENNYTILVLQRRLTHLTVENDSLARDGGHPGLCLTSNNSYSDHDTVHVTMNSKVISKGDDILKEIQRI
ncbi:hypothetical protein HETIRDRAFT_166771 [Heterobasidion irregulare TC 32-1]|uniref:Uncharacterized protein n=1 Tax=Heterobasidion irregulare (strain TC 32-1) TaxID=747525 RepID=W4KN40_HETIT|nr:uncharacterized protein HETIRDRAFT_166771 [Heterobasidion irregulare TC 32-1]ETW87232.1 hypothetical protein HETIRDRAFT_166771 [Heterobasidion irregulare TC 32-1]